MMADFRGGSAIRGTPNDASARELGHPVEIEGEAGEMCDDSCDSDGPSCETKTLKKDCHNNDTIKDNTDDNDDDDSDVDRTVQLVFESHPFNDFTDNDDCIADSGIIHGGDDNDNEDNGDNRSRNTNVDKGYAWVIVAAVLLLHFLLIGYLKSGGVFFVEFQRKFESNASMTSLIIGLAEGVFSISAPLVMGPLVKKLSVRKICLFGSLVFSAGVIGNSFCQRIELLILTHSLAFGFAKALLLGPSFIIINSYFVKRRALATAIATTGASLGGIAFPLLARVFYDGYEFWGGTMLTGGVILHSFIGSVLLSPPEASHDTSKKDGLVLENDGEDGDDIKHLSLYLMDDSGSLIMNAEADDSSYLQTFQSQKDTCRDATTHFHQKYSGWSNSNSFEDLHSSKYTSNIDQNSCTLETTQITTTQNSLDSKPFEIQIKENNILPVNRIPNPSNNQENQKTPTHKGHSSTNETSMSNSCNFPDYQKPAPITTNSNSNTHNTPRTNTHIKYVKTRKHPSLLLSPSTKPPTIKNTNDAPTVESPSKTLLMPPNPTHPRHRLSQNHLSDSIMFHSTSTLDVLNLNDKEEVITQSSSPHNNKNNYDTASQYKNNRHSSIRQLFIRICHKHPVLRSASFWVLVPFYFAGLVGSGLPQVFFFPLAKERGLTDHEASLCLSVQSAIDILAHIAPGLILNTAKVKSTSISVIPMAVMGVAGHLVPFFHSFVSIMLLSVLYGLCIGFFFTLQSLFVIDTLGAENFAWSMGLYFLTMGVAGATGFPIAGALKDLTGTYSTTFHYLATMQLLAASILLVLPLVRQYDVRRGVLRN